MYLTKVSRRLSVNVGFRLERRLKEQDKMMKRIFEEKKKLSKKKHLTLTLEYVKQEHRVEHRPKHF